MRHASREGSVNSFRVLDADNSRGGGNFAPTPVAHGSPARDWAQPPQAACAPAVWTDAAHAVLHRARVPP